MQAYKSNLTSDDCQAQVYRQYPFQSVVNLGISFFVVVIVVQYTKKKFACLKRREEKRICIKQKKKHKIHI